MAQDSIKRPKANIFRSTRWQQDHSTSTKAPRSNKNEICKIAHLCGSCQYINTEYQHSLGEKYQQAIHRFRAAQLLEGANVAEPVASPRTTGYRCHAKLAVRPVAESVRPRIGERFAIGLFQPQSHKLVPLDTCPLHRASINRLLPDLKAELEASSIQPYSELNHEGHLRYIAIRASHLTEELMLTFVLTDDSMIKEIKAMILRLRQKEHILVAVYININSDRTNTIFGAENKKVLGADGLRESLCDLTFEIGPTSFFQVNPWQAELIYRRVEQLAGAPAGSDVAWDLYCGTGQISLLLSKQGYRTLGIEENPLAIADAEANIARNEIPADEKPYYIAGRVEDVVADFPQWSQKPAVIVANPSRRGLADNARQLITQGLAQREDTRFIYVSCEAETMVRDLQQIVQSTGRSVRQLECFDMFPFTEKLEWIAVLQ